MRGARIVIRAFTLVELMIVIALIATLSVVAVNLAEGGGESAGLVAGQSGLAGLVTVARTKAITTGNACRVLLNIDPDGTPIASRFLRCLVVQVQVGAAWQTISEFYLPKHVFLVPGDFAALPAGLFADGAAVWVRADLSTPLRSSTLRTAQIVSEAVNASVAEKWVSFSISGVGTTAQAGDLVLAVGRQRPAGSYGAGESPIELINPERVCGLTLSSYGLATLISDRASF